MPGWGKKGSRNISGYGRIAVSVVRGNPATSIQMMMRRLFMQMGGALIIFLLPMIVPMVKEALKDWSKSMIAAEVKRRLDLERAEIYKQAYTAMSEADRQVLQEFSVG